MLSDSDIPPGRTLAERPPRVAPKVVKALEETCRIVAETIVTDGLLPPMGNLGNHDDRIRSSRRSAKRLTRRKQGN